MNRSIHRISLDIHKVGSQAVLNVKKGDTARSICVTLTENGRPYEIVENCSAVFSAKKPDGNYILNDCAIQGSEILYDFTPQTAPVAGAMECEVSLYDKSGNQITSPRFLIVVDEVVYNDEEIVSSNEANALKALIIETSEATTNAQEAIALATEVTSNAEEVAALAVEATEGADRSAKLATDAADNANKAAASVSGVKEEMYELLGKKPLNLLDSNNIKRWDVVRQSSSSPYSMYAGAVDLTEYQLDGITGVLSLVKTNVTDANYVDFIYRNAINLGDEFSILLTAFIKSNLNNDGTNNPNQNSYVELNLGSLRILLVRKAEDAPSETAWNRCNFRVIVDYSYWEDVDEYPYVFTSDLIPTDTTTTLYDGKPSSELDSVAQYIQNSCLGISGRPVPGTPKYTRDSGWKDLLISYKDRILTVKDCKGNVLFSSAPLPMRFSFENVKPKVRIYSDSILMKDHTSDVFRLEMSSAYINKIHEHENKDVLDSITQEVADGLSQAAFEFKVHEADTNNPHQVTTEQIGTLSKDEIVERIDKASKGELNLLDSDHITKWNIIRESDNPDTPADTEYNHYAGAVDMSEQGIEGVTGMLAQLQTNSFTTNWTDFVYDGTVDLGCNFSMLITPFIKNYASSDVLPNNNSYVEVKLGLLSVRLSRKWEDAQTTSGFYKLHVGLYMEGNEYPIADTDVITSCTGDYATYPTTTLYDGKPAIKSPLGDKNSSVMTYVREHCPAQNGHILPTTENMRFSENYGWKDITIKVRNGVLSVLDANGNPFKFLGSDGTYSVEEANLFASGVPTEVFYGITPKVRFFHDTAVMLYNPEALMRFEVKVDNGCYCAEPLTKLGFAVYELQNNQNTLNETVTNLSEGTSAAFSMADSAVGTVNSFVEEYGPKMDTYATEIFVINKIAEAELSGGEVDLSGYATTEQLNEVDEKASQAIFQSSSVADDVALALEDIGLLYPRVETLETQVGEMSGSVEEAKGTAYAAVEQVSVLEGSVEELGNQVTNLDANIQVLEADIESRIGEIDYRATEAHDMAESALGEVGKAADFLNKYYHPLEVLTDALLIYIGQITNLSHDKSYVVNASTSNVPVADSTFRGFRYPIITLRHSADNIDYIIKITEVKPVLGRQWINCYSTATSSWHGWTEV